MATPAALIFSKNAPLNPPVPLEKLLDFMEKKDEFELQAANALLAKEDPNFKKCVLFLSGGIYTNFPAGLTQADENNIRTKRDKIELDAEKAGVIQWLQYAKQYYGDKGKQFAEEIIRLQANTPEGKEEEVAEQFFAKHYGKENAKIILKAKEELDAKTEAENEAVAENWRVSTPTAPLKAKL